MKTKKNNAIEKFLCILLLLTLAATVFINYHVAHHVLDDDASSELILAEALLEEKSLYSRDFYYSTEYFVQNQLIFGFLFHFFDGWANVRFLGTCMIQLLYLASFLYMMSQSGLSRKAVLLSGILIMLPFTVVYGRTILYHVYYVCNFAPTYVLTGLLFSFFRKPDSSRFSTLHSSGSCGGDLIFKLFFVHSSGISDHSSHNWMSVFLSVISFGKKEDSLGKVDVDTGFDAVFRWYRYVV